jgi:uncharacterized protein YeeX (DUF496 family)
MEENTPKRTRRTKPFFINSHPELVSEWDSELNGKFNIEQISNGSGLLVNWICPRCKIKYVMKVCGRTRGGDCPNKCIVEIRRKNRRNDNLGREITDTIQKLLDKANTGNNLINIVEYILYSGDIEGHKLIIERLDEVIHKDRDKNITKLRLGLEGPKFSRERTGRVFGKTLGELMSIENRTLENVFKDIKFENKKLSFCDTLHKKLDMMD